MNEYLSGSFGWAARTVATQSSGISVNSFLGTLLQTLSTTIIFHVHNTAVTPRKEEKSDKIEKTSSTIRDRESCFGI